MKKKTPLILLMLLSVALSTHAVTIDDIAYILNENDMTAEVTSGGNYSGEVVIPSSVTTNNGKTYSVTSIGYSAFWGCSGLKSVTIGNSVTSIGGYAFYQCTSLTSMTIPNNVTTIGKYAFDGCSGLTSVHISDLSAWCNIDFKNHSNPLYYAHHLYLNEMEIIDLVVPNSVTSIGNSAFSGCSGLTSVTIPESVTSIGESAFSGCI